jgi:hypothetical protein
MDLLDQPKLPLTVEVMQAVRNAFPADFQCAVPVDDLVEAGFRYLGPEDAVKCQYCDLELCNWKPEDSAMEEHRTNSPNCPMFLYEATG